MTREKLSIIHVFLTNKATYVVYNTQTIQGKDCVNIQIERDGKIILKNEIFNDSFGAMCGDSFHSLVVDALNHTRSYIKDRGETILTDAKTQSKDTLIK